MFSVKYAVVASMFVVSVADAATADLVSVSALFQSIVAQTDDARLPRPEQTGMQMLGLVMNLTPDEVREALPLAQSCMGSERHAIRVYGIQFMALAAIRADSAELLKPFTADVTALWNEPGEGIRNGAIFILGRANPKPTSEGLAYLTAHLGDESNSPEQVGTIAGAVLSNSPDAETIRRVLAAVRPRHDAESVKAKLIEMLATVGVYSAEALRYIRDGLTDDNRGVNEAAVAAVAGMPKNIRMGYVAELQNLASDAGAPGGLRERARLALSQ